MEGQKTKEAESTAYFSGICIERCGGMCCDPWWGIISYTIVKEGGLSSLGPFRAELIRSINARAKRIVENYVTGESPSPSRPLFTRPQRYNVAVRDIRFNGASIALSLLAMFAFRCNFLSDDKACLIHPSVTGAADIRPPHCGFMGSLNVRPGEKGYCRIIHAAEGAEAGDETAVNEAIRVEKGAGEKYFNEGFLRAEEAADSVISQMKSLSAERAPHLLPAQKRVEKTPGRNDPCWCGSGKKFKK
ncbi:MAG: SEC-C metal-binding domain-containing protein, partial [Deltaproteobacteria bacterium]|nr:SEC-C metal-binding domain-containing protein [Deltaproteobacteria bacterium]